MTDEKLDILQNLEFSIVEIWRDNPQMSDYVALRAYEAAFHGYREELRGHVVKPHGLKDLDAVTFESLKSMCEFRLGRGLTPLPAGEKIEPISLELLVDCLRELVKSVQRHTKAGGRQGYLTFIDQFLP